MRGVRALMACLVLLALTGAALAYTIQTENKGPEEIELNGGPSGPVPFPHRAHQSKLVDCAVCHTLFPQKIGAIDALKASGELEKKQVMNKHCVKCHRQMAKAGEPTGPTTCKGCHLKS